jgi:hypothetical protein
MIDTCDNNPRILAYIAAVPALARIHYTYFDKRTKKKIDAGRKMSAVDETAWCACFVSWCPKKARMHAPGHLLARDLENYGTLLDHAPHPKGFKAAGQSREPLFRE